MSKRTDATVDDVVIEDVVTSTGPQLVRAVDPAASGRLIATALGAEVGEPEALADLVEQRSQLVGTVVVEHLTDLYGLVDRIERARTMVTRTVDTVRVRAETASGLVVHPDAIRTAAAAVVAARTEHDEAIVAFEAIEAREASATDTSPDRGAAAATTADDTELWPERRDAPSWRTVGLLLAGVTLTAAGVTVAMSLSDVRPLVLLVPVLVGLILLLTRSPRAERRDEGDQLAAENLAAVAAVTDQAYGGTAGMPAWQSSPELAAARARQQAARQRRRVAEADWVALVGPDADPADLDSVLRARDAQFDAIPDEVVESTPTVRVARRLLRRLEAEWKVAWWALDRPVPPMEQARAAVDGLDREGVTTVTAQVAGPMVPVVVIDPDGSVDEDAFAAMTSALPAEVRVIVVAPLA